MSAQRSAKQRVLLVIHLNTYFVGLLPVARLLKSSVRYEPVVFFARTYPAIAGDVATCEAEAIPHLTQATEWAMSQSDPPPADNGKLPWKKRIKRWQECLPKPLQCFVRHIVCRVRHSLTDNVLYHLRCLSRQIRLVRQLIREQNAVLMVLAADNRYDLAAFVKAAHQEQIPVVVVPSFMANALEWAEFVANIPDYSLRKWSNRLVGMLYPRWIYQHNGRKLLALPASQVLAREWLGIAPPLPWILHSGHTDTIVVESEAMRRYCLSEGLPLDKVVVTGSIVHDEMAKILKDAPKERANLYQALGLRAGRPMILAALPPDFLYRIGGRPECDFKTYGELVRFWVQSLADLKDYNIVIALHPSVSYKDMKYIEQWGVKIAQAPTASLIPLCHIYVASISATIQWAIACGRPVLNYDVYRYRYTDYAGAEGVITLEGQSDFVVALRRLAYDQEFFTEMVSRQAACASQWGKLDGCSGQRMLQLFDQLVKEYEKRCRC